MRKILFFNLAFVAVLNFFGKNCFAKPNPQNIYWVVLAGGSGTRLWPLSRADKPKQFLSVTDSNLIQQTVDRLKKYPDFDKTHLYISSGADVAHQIRKIQAEIPEIEGIIEEPGRRDTGPAILLAAMTILKKDPQAVIMFLPADPYIPVEHYETFSKVLVNGMDALEKNKDKVLLLGKKPTFASTGFGYIEYQEKKSKFRADSSFRIKKFHEKPKLEVAQSYLRQENMLWNMGMFTARADTFQRLFKKYANRMYNGVEKFLNKEASFNDVEKISIDFAIMEPSSRDGNLMVLPIKDFNWYDVGNVDIFMRIKNQFTHENNLPEPNLIEHEAKNNKIYLENSKKVAVLLGVDGLCVVDTEDSLLITKCTEAEKVKQVVETMKSQQDKYGTYL